MGVDELFENKEISNDDEFLNSFNINKEKLEEYKKSIENYNKKKEIFKTIIKYEEIKILEEDDLSNSIKSYENLKKIQKKLPSKKFLIEDFVWEKGISMIHAGSNVGKTIFLKNLISSLNNDNNKAFKQIKQNIKVLFLDGEMDEYDFFHDLELFNINNSIKEKNIFYTDKFGKLDLMNCLKLNHHLKKMEEDGNKIDIIFLDTFIAFFDGDNENDSTKIRYFIRNLQRIIKERNVSFVITHHHAKGGYKGKDSIRGSGDIFASMDVVWNLGVDKTQTFYLKLDKMRRKSKRDIKNKKYKIKEEGDKLVFEFEESDYALNSKTKPKDYVKERVFEVLEFEPKTFDEIYEILDNEMTELLNKTYSEKTIRNYLSEIKNISFNKNINRYELKNE